MAFFIDLREVPEFAALHTLVMELKQEISVLRAGQAEWVHTDEAVRITGLSRNTLWRLRQQPGTLIQWKSDGGVRYLRESLHAHNRSRAVARI